MVSAVNKALDLFQCRIHERHAKRTLTLISIRLTLILILYLSGNTHWTVNFARLVIYALCGVVGDQKRISQVHYCTRHEED
ncbi:hypothetical protein BJY00DRAFT_78153 [Aspergillus carlsbadensis]|nr:hypothetical protein BJY00DRAFT_78153 [Aspergillus carlsbadensis]